MAKGVKITDKAIMSAIKACKGLVYLTARKLGCDPSTIHRRAAKNPKIKTLIHNERQECVDTAELSLLTAVANGESWAVCFTLKTQGRDRGYVERQEIKQESSVTVKTVEDISDDELIAIARSGSKFSAREKESTKELN